MFASEIQAPRVGGHGRCLVGMRGRGLVVVAMALVGSFTTLVSASSALAEPTGIFKVFEECPRGTPGIVDCVFGRITGGEFAIGGARIPIDKTLTLQVGEMSAGNPENEAEYFGLPAKNGESLSKTELNVPANLFGLEVTVRPELVSSKERQLIINEFALTREEGAGLTLPLRFHLKGPFLGESCYIGSESDPAQLRLTTGETHPPKGFSPLHGKAGTVSGLQENGHDLLHLTGLSLVDNTFSLPGVEGCGEGVSSRLLDMILDEILKIPNKAGENAAVLRAEMEIVSPEELTASER
jgi:hypothetical protein